MTLIILLIVLVTERVALQGANWRVERYLSWYVEHGSKSLLKRAEDNLALFIFMAVPALSFGIVLMLLDSDFVDFLVSILVLAVCVGNSNVRTFYRQYLNAQNRNDEEAQEILQAKLLVADGIKLDLFQAQEPESEKAESEEPEQEGTENPASVNDRGAEQLNIGEILIWNNFKYYAAPIFYFVLFGVPGVIFYATLLYLVESQLLHRKFENLVYLKQAKSSLSIWLEWGYWLPARLVAIGYMFVGHFSNGLEAWLKNAADLKISSQSMICKVATAAEAGNPGGGAKQMVRLAKRNMVFFLVIVALLTLYGQII